MKASYIIIESLAFKNDKRGTWDLVSEDRSYPFDLGKSQARFMNASYIIIESLAFKNMFSFWITIPRDD